jgi:hypothetical protein
VEAVDLRHVPVVDNHCHGILRSQSFGDLLSWRRNFTESVDPGVPRGHVASTAFYLRLIRALAGFLDCEPDEETVLATRAEKDEQELVGALLWAANVETLLLDTGYPPPEKVLPGAELSRLGDCRVKPMLRLETLMERLIAEHDSLEEAKEAFVAALDDVRGQGYAALKSIAAYRTGLNIREWSREEAEASFDEFQGAVREGSARLNHKPLLDTLLHAAFAGAARQEVLLGDPLHLRAVLEKPEYRGMPVVLLHGCYPYTRKGGYLAAVYENVYLDLSYGIPFLGFAGMLSVTREALSVAPISKLMYSSDGIGVPELHWMGATDGRRVLSQALEELVVHGELSIPEAEAAGEDVLRGNAIRLYRLSLG